MAQYDGAITLGKTSEARHLTHQVGPFSVCASQQNRITLLFDCNVALFLCPRQETGPRQALAGRSRTSGTASPARANAISQASFSDMERRRRTIQRRLLGLVKLRDAFSRWGKLAIRSSEGRHYKGCSRLVIIRIYSVPKSEQSFTLDHDCLPKRSSRVVPNWEFVPKSEQRNRERGCRDQERCFSFMRRPNLSGV
jgi:hypothetical protein